MSSTLRSARTAVAALGVALATLVTVAPPPAAAAGPAPTSLSPNDATVTTYKNLELSWAPVAGALSYQVQVDDDLDFAGPEIYEAATTVPFHTLPVSLPRGTYAWHVRAQTSAGFGDWSGAARFTRGWTGGPSGLQATGGMVPMLRWNPLADASFYEVEISDQPFDDAPSDTGRVNHWLCYTNHTSLAPYGVAAGREDPPGDEADCPFVYDAKSEPAENGTFPAKFFPGTFHWRVRGRDSSVDTRTTTFTNPALSCTGVWPEGGGTGSADGVTFPVPYTPPKYLERPECSSWSTGGSFEIDWTSTAGSLRLPRSFGTSSEKPSATVTCPQPLEEDGESPTFEATLWIQGGDAGHNFTTPYELDSVSPTKEAWATPILLTSGLTFQQALTNHAGTTLQGAYRLYATCRINGDVRDGAVSDRIVFTSPTAYEMYPLTGTTVEPTAGNPAAANVSLTDTPRFAWSTVEDAVKYRVYVSRTASFVDSDHVWETQATSLQPYGDFADRALPTYWGVQACGFFRCGRITPAKQFVQATKNNVSALSAVASGGVVTLSWATQTPAPGSPVADAPEAKAYQVQVDEIGGDFSSPVTTVLTDRIGTTAGMARWRAASSSLPNQFIWRVRAQTETGYPVPWSATATYDVVRPVASLSTASGFSLTSPLTIVLSEPVTGASSSTLQVRPTDSATPVSGTLTALSATAYRFTPSAPWVAGRSYRLAVSGLADTAGNPALAATSSVKATTVTDSASPALRKVAGDAAWTTRTASDAVGASYVLSVDNPSTAARSYVATSVYGSRVTVYGCRGPSAGRAVVFVDGAAVTLDLYRSYSGCGVVWTSPVLASGVHQLSVGVLGSRNASSTGTGVGVDAVRVA